MSTLRVMLVVGLLAWAGTAQAEMEVPMPAGVIGVSDRHDVQLGAQAFQVEGYVSKLPPEELVKFFTRKLPEAGWEIKQLPWEGDREALAEQLEQRLLAHPDTPPSPAIEAKIEELRNEPLLPRKFYASNGRESVIINLWPMNEQIAIFVNRWRGGDPAWMREARSALRLGTTAKIRDRNVQADADDAQYRQRPGDDGADWLDANVCCSGKGIPEGVEAMPFSVPQYPGSAALARSTASNRDGRDRVLLTAADGIETIAAYYRTQMPYNGWDLVDEEEQRDQTSTGRVLRYRKPDRLCVLTISRVTSQDVAEAGSMEALEGEVTSQTLVTIAVTPRRARGRAGR